MDYVSNVINKNFVQRIFLKTNLRFFAGQFPVKSKIMFNKYLFSIFQQQNYPNQLAKFVSVYET